MSVSFVKFSFLVSCSLVETFSTFLCTKKVSDQVINIVLCIFQFVWYSVWNKYNVESLEESL